MFPRLFMIAALLFALPAHAGIEETYARWEALRDPDAATVAFDDAYGFLKAYPGWPQENVIRQRAEQAALLERPAPAVLQKFCAEFPPVSGRGMFACVNAAAGDDAQRKEWIKQGWLKGDFNEDEEENILANYPFTPDEQVARTDRLLYENKISGAKRMLHRLTPMQRMLAEARLALVTDGHDINAKLYNVPKALRNDPGMLFNRMQWRARHGDDDGVTEMLLSGPKNPPYADLWWPYRAAAVRQALEDNRAGDAVNILARHGDLNSENLADARFLNGWIAMEFRGDPRTGYKDFYALYGEVSTPVSKARAAYWAGRAAKKNGNPEIARGWFEKAAAFSTVFYGQLAANELKEDAPLALPAAPDTGEVPNPPVAEAALWLANNHENDMADLFLASLTDKSDDASADAALADYAIAHHYPHGAVKVAKQALRKNVVLIDEGWPVIGVPPQNPIEPALALAIARQESEFDPHARSGADARGLMQLLPGTADHIAHRASLPYSAKDLYEPEANIAMGSSYLGALVNGFDGNYILAIASYNAGPSNVRKWITRFGWPPKDTIGAVNWIEKIPFAETRNYVMRVMENLQVYRTRLHEDAPLALAKDLAR